VEPRSFAPHRGAVQRPVGLFYGPGHLIVHGNPPFIAEFGRESLGLPAAEALLDLPSAAFAFLDLVFREGRPLACEVTIRGARRRLTAVARRDIETGEVYGVAMRLAPPPEAIPGE
jgi:hypothetical protein